VGLRLLLPSGAGFDHWAGPPERRSRLHDRLGQRLHGHDPGSRRQHVP